MASPRSPRSARRRTRLDDDTAVRSGSSPRTTALRSIEYRMREPHRGHRAPGPKTRAIDAHRSPDRIYDLNVEADWAEVHDLGNGRLACPWCDIHFTKPIENSNGTRFLSDLGERRGPTEPSSGGGGPMSRQHLWLQKRIESICRDLRYDATLERGQENAIVDVSIDDGRFSIEVQRWITNVDARTEQRLATSSGVLWLITHDAPGDPRDLGLITSPSVRIEVVHKDDWSKRLAPWDHRHEARDARLVVYMNVVKRVEHGRPVTGRYSGYGFLEEVLSGTRNWHEAHSRFNARDRGLWILDSDLTSLDPGRNAPSVRAETADVVPVTSDSRSAPNPGSERSADLDSEVGRESVTDFKPLTSRRRRRTSLAPLVVSGLILASLAFVAVLIVFR